MIRNTSIATIDSPEFIDVSPQNDMISKCDIKVLYLGENRNHSFITKDVAKQMANSLPGCPIVAAFNEEKKDFGDHGHVVTIEDGEIKFSCKTIPYGFVSPDADVWFQKFIDIDALGQQVEREYLMTSGYLWTGQYPEIQKAIDEGLPQSMELDDETLDGRWVTNNDSGVEFFIINDATFSKLCILGSDVEPCFEGASVTSSRFSKEPEFVFTLLKMREELNHALQKEGGLVMDNIEVAAEVEASEAETEFVEAAETAEAVETPEVEAEFVEAETEAENVEFEAAEEEVVAADTAEFSASEESEPTTYVDKKDEEEESDEEDSADDSGEDDEEDKPSTDHSLEVEAEFAAVKAELESVKAQLSDANAELESLRSYKLGIENQQKQAEISKYYMLDDADKAELIENIENYSLDEIKASLALKYVEKFADFEVHEEVEENEEAPLTTFSLDTAVNKSFTDTLGAALMAKRN